MTSPLDKLQEDYRRAVDAYREILHKHYDPIQVPSGTYMPLPLTDMTKMKVEKAKADMELARDAVTVYMLEMLITRA